MKKLGFLAVFIIACLHGFSQITSFKVESYNDYDDQTRIYYLSIEGVQNEKQADIVRDEIMKNPMVFRFTFYEKSQNLNKCMAQTDQALDEIQLNVLMNDILTTYQINEKQIQEILNEMPVLVNTGNPERDKDAYWQKKKEWIEKNPEKYNMINQAGDILDPNNSEKISKEQTQK